MQRSGLSLGVMGNARVGANARYGNTPAPTTAGEAAYGTALNTAPASAALTPAEPGGLAFWLGVAGIALLGGLYWSLPG